MDIKEYENLLRLILDPSSRARAILECIGKAETEITLEEIANSLEISKKTAANNLSMLMKTGLIARVKKNRYIIPRERYTLLRMILMLSEQILDLTKKVEGKGA
ncbi:MAG: helix-turn-helix domain-containing protein [Candidatus Odinarchaeota archaeon]|nr:helix-turn-helix domain-containing protein [Candidatus Odinarchaeota archaeon]